MRCFSKVDVVTEALFDFFVVALLRVKSRLVSLRSIQSERLLQNGSTNACFLALLSSLAVGRQAVPISNCSDCRLTVVPFLNFNSLWDGSVLSFQGRGRYEASSSFHCAGQMHLRDVKDSQTGNAVLHCPENVQLVKWSTVKAGVS